MNDSWCPGRIIYVDVDDTIIDFSDNPKAHVIDWLKGAYAAGAEMYLWSQGGADYARDHAERLGIAALFRAFLPKPEVVLDDLKIEAKFILRHIHPIQLVGLND